MITRRGFVAALAAIPAALGIPWCRRSPPAEWTVSEDEQLDAVRVLLDPFRGRHLRSPEGGGTHWLVQRMTDHHRYFILYADSVRPVPPGSDQFLSKAVVFSFTELFTTRFPRRGIHRRLALADKQPWRRLGMYQVDPSPKVPINDHAFDEA